MRRELHLSATADPEKVRRRSEQNCRSLRCADDETVCWGRDDTVQRCEHCSRGPGGQEIDDGGCTFSSVWNDVSRGNHEKRSGGATLRKTVCLSIRHGGKHNCRVGMTPRNNGAWVTELRCFFWIFEHQVSSRPERQLHRRVVERPADLCCGSRLRFATRSAPGIEEPASIAELQHPDGTVGEDQVPFRERVEGNHAYTASVIAVGVWGSESALRKASASAAACLWRRRSRA